MSPTVIEQSMVQLGFSQGLLSQGLVTSIISGMRTKVSRMVIQQIRVQLGFLSGFSYLDNLISHELVGDEDEGKRNGLRRPNKCQKRPTTGAKETCYVRTFENLPAMAARSVSPLLRSTNCRSCTYIYIYIQPPTYSRYSRYSRIPLTNSRYSRYSRYSLTSLTQPTIYIYIYIYI